jgi:hypothetical protein
MSPVSDYTTTTNIRKTCNKRFENLLRNKKLLSFHFGNKFYTFTDVNCNFAYMKYDSEFFFGFGLSAYICDGLSRSFEIFINYKVVKIYEELQFIMHVFFLLKFFGFFHFLWLTICNKKASFGFFGVL